MAQLQPHVCPIIVGRDRELSVTSRLLVGVASGRCEMLLVSGEAGIGKSRLARALTGAARDRGFRVLEGICDERDRDLPFAVFVDCLRQELHGRPGHRIRQLLEKDAEVFARLVPELRPPSPERSPLTAEQEKRRIFEAFTDLFVGLSGERPLLLLMEDLHWADETSLELLQLVPRRLAGVPVFILATARSDEPGSCLDPWLAFLERRRLLTRIELSPLNGAEVARMIEATLGRPAPTAAVAAIQRRAEGNPFLVEEFLRELADTADAQRSDISRWRTVEALDIPFGVTETIRRRLSSLDAGARTVACLAAVVGRRFTFELLRELTGMDEAELIHALRALIAQQLVTEEAGDGGSVFAFRHALTRDAIYRGLLGPERRQLHSAVARALGVRADPTLDGELGYHHYEAHEWAPALDCARRAGDAAQSVSATAEALSHYRRALDAAGRLGQQGESAVTELHCACGKLAALLGLYDEARAHFDYALLRAGASGGAPIEQRVLYELAGLYASRDYDAALAYGTRALELARALGDPCDEARALNRLGNIAVNQARFDEGLVHHRAALGSFERLGDRWGRADSLDLIGMAHYLAGDVPEAREDFRQAVELFDELGDKERIASSMTSRALYLAVLDGPCAFDGSPDECLAEAEAAVELCRQIDWRAGEAYALTTVASAQFGRGDYGDGLRAAEASYQLALEIEHQQWAIISQLTRAIALADLGDAATALSILEPLRESARRMGAAQWMRRIEAWTAHCKLHLGLIEEADRILRPLLPAGPRPRSISERRALFTLAELELRRGRTELALDAVQRLELGPQPHQAAHMIPAVLMLRAEALGRDGQSEAARTALLSARELATHNGPRGLLWRISAELGMLIRHSGRSPRDELARGRAELLSLLRSVEDEQLRDTIAGAPQARVLGVSDMKGSERDILTRREREVAAMVAQGKTNRQIADELFLSEKTVEMHVSNSFGKLGFSSRAQLAVWVAQRKLPDGR